MRHCIIAHSAFLVFTDRKGITYLPTALILSLRSGSMSLCFSLYCLVDIRVLISLFHIHWCGGLRRESNNSRYGGSNPNPSDLKLESLCESMKIRHT